MNFSCAPSVSSIALVPVDFCTVSVPLSFAVLAPLSSLPIAPGEIGGQMNYVRSYMDVGR